MSLWEQLKDHVSRSTKPLGSYSSLVNKSASLVGGSATLEIHPKELPPIKSDLIGQRVLLEDIQPALDVSMPFETGELDMVAISRCLERCRSPDRLAHESLRVVRSGGMIVGLCSQAQAATGDSFYNITPVGLLKLYTQPGVADVQLAPVSDILSLVNRILPADSPTTDLNLFEIIENQMLEDKRSGRSINVKKLQYAATFYFQVSLL